ncbi:MAG: putative photosynthetic complex assembly protein PuhE [Chloroherpetonaceae bacterium]|nr:putative photosynthetic complex assembly protein PuhE [Chloroherpetonaceae bacterium]
MPEEVSDTRQINSGSSQSQRRTTGDFLDDKLTNLDNHIPERRLHRLFFSNGFKWPLTQKQSRVFTAFFFSLIFWWFSTAVIMYLSFIPNTRTLSFLFSLGLALVSLYLLYHFRNDRSERAIYISFTAGVLIWAFVEVSFYSGYIVGPRVRPIFSIKPSMDSFFRAVHQSAYHEGLVLFLACLIFGISAKAKNKFGLYVYLMFWFMHQSAKLNIFLGVMNTGKELVPETVESMTHYMTIAHMNWLFPFSITLTTLIAAYVWNKVKQSDEAWIQVGFSLIGTMSILALLEHWLLVVPLDQSIWEIVVKRLH